MLDYLNSAGFHSTVEALKQDSHLEDFVPDPKAKWSGLLEKKWTSVIRLQKKVGEGKRYTLLSPAYTASPHYFGKLDYGT